MGICFYSGRHRFSAIDKVAGAGVADAFWGVDGCFPAVVGVFLGTRASRPQFLLEFPMTGGPFTTNDGNLAHGSHGLKTDQSKPIQALLDLFFIRV
jgi:hypothetical protein